MLNSQCPNGALNAATLGIEHWANLKFEIEHWALIPLIPDP
jgi:hypothetical protein